MGLRSTRVFGHCYEPDKCHSHNYMFDTTAINKLVERPDDVNILMRASQELGYEYFRCRIQDGEIIGMKSDSSFHKEFSSDSVKSVKMREIIKTLSIRKVPCIAAFVQRGIILNGTSYLADSNGKRLEVFERVFNGNPENIEDAIIVESGIHHNCIIVSNDKAMCDNTRAIFPGKAIWYKRFIDNIKEKTR